MLTDSRFWFGVVAGVAGVYAYNMYRVKRASN